MRVAGQRLVDQISPRRSQEAPQREDVPRGERGFELGHFGGQSAAESRKLTRIDHLADVLVQLQVLLVILANLRERPLVAQELLLDGAVAGDVLGAIGQVEWLTAPPFEQHQ